MEIVVSIIKSNCVDVSYSSSIKVKKKSKSNTYTIVIFTKRIHLIS